MSSSILTGTIIPSAATPPAPTMPKMQTIIAGEDPTIAHGQLVPHQAVGERPYSIWTAISVEPGADGVPRTDVPAVATSKQSFRLTKDARDGVLELRLPSDKMLVMRAWGDNRKLDFTVDGTKLIVERPKDGHLTIDAAMHSTPEGPLTHQVDRVLLGDSAIQVVAGATGREPTRGPVGIAEHVVRFDARGWEVTAASAQRSRADYVHRLDETVQTHFSAPIEDSFHAVATYTGKVNGHAAEGLVANARRGFQGFLTSAGGTIFHLLER